MKDVSIMIDDVKFNYRAGLLIERNGKVLIEFNPDFDFTTLPGGRVKTLESSFDGLKREIEEEMGIIIERDEIELISLVENFFGLDNKKYHELCIVYKLVVDSNDKRFKDDMKNLDSKASYYKWIDSDKLDEVNLLPKVLREAAKIEKFENLVVNDL